MSDINLKEFYTIIPFFFVNLDFNSVFHRNLCVCLWSVAIPEFT